MTLDQFRHVADRLLDPFVSLSTKLGVTPDAISALAFVVAAAAGGAYYLAGDAALWYFAGAVLVGLNGWLDILDGAVAREMGTDSKAGDLLDHVLDRYADIVMVAGLAAGLDRYGLGLAAVTGVLMTSYLGTQSQAVGLDRVYGGMLGRADRLALIGIVTGVAAFVDVAALGFGLVGWLLVVFAVVGHVTALQRFWGAWRALS
ncbi:CDP-alcohol phosphatidyltransferase family protein [Natronoarchaeum rubrum]|uniref:CDP-alcohol phosphatidyltransferase family protein n=1 Tax=Natronoarchaeum rubrum TaxID=755311 RepID=UPI002110F845|nr:CDP-alcohol phosphatidyltransferase family protein [Natronoarchaeum rubrum]HMB49226.1 CDP-alcohol phosphatidyltransferase family protein [Natronoarchaeum rubrum]